MFWGLTPALDICEEYLQHCQKTPEELNVLLVGGADSRHVLQTIARKYRHKNIKINFYLMEGCVETIGKQLLLLYLALQPQKVLGLVQKTRIFMELYGNTLVRPATAKYLNVTAQELVKMVTDYDYLQKILPYLSVDIKYKERDYLENLVKFWCSNDEFDICHCWDLRLRKFLGVRYDSKAGAFDWDLHMRFHSVGGQRVCNQEYRTFRQNGVAFNWLESEVSKPNRSMVCVIVPNGEKLAHYGYLGDMQTGPFVSYGLDCEDKQFLKSTNGQNAYRATDITERNLMQIFHEIEFGTKYVHQPLNDMQMGTVTMQEDINRVIDFKAINSVRKNAVQCIDLQNVQIKFLSLGKLDMMKYKEEYKDMFHVIYFGSAYIKFLSKELIQNVAASEALLVLENQKFVLSLRDKDLEKFKNNLQEKVSDIDLKNLPFDVKKDDYVKFIINSNGKVK